MKETKNHLYRDIDGTKIKLIFNNNNDDNAIIDSAINILASTIDIKCKSAI